MKRYRRIEITAFRRRITIVSCAVATNNTDADVRLNNAKTQEAIELESAEGQRILLEAVRLLEEKLLPYAQQDF